MISFGNPAALLWLLALVPVALAAAYAGRRRRRADEAFGGPPALRWGRAPWRRPLQLVLLLAALALAAVAVARPQWGTEERELTRLGIDVAIALDISRSMTATDLEPSRAEAAAAGLQEMLNHLRGDRVGLVTFAGDAFERSPLTLDLKALGQLLARSQNEAALVRQGTDLGDAIDVSLRLLAVENPANTQVVVLISDGEDLGDELGPAIERARDLGIRIYTVAAGTAAGGAIPPREGEEGGGGEISRADRATLAGIAEATGGDRRELESIVGLAVEFQRLRQSAFDEGSDDAPVEGFQWFLGAALLLLGLQMLVAEAGLRRSIPRGRITLGSAALLAVAIVVACGSAEYGRVRDGNDAYADGRYTDALTAYREARELAPDAPEIDYNAGNALHQLARYEEATVASAAAAGATEDPELFARSTYAVGSHAFRRDDLEAAREAYISVLLHNPDDRDAKHNLELTLRRLAGDDPEAPRGGGNVPGPDAEDQPPNAGDGTPGPGEAPDVDTPPGDEQQPQPGDPEAGGESDQADPTAGDGPMPPTTVEDAQALLSEALLRLGDDALTLEDAISILDLVRVTNELESLEPRTGGAGGLPDR